MPSSLGRSFTIVGDHDDRTIEQLARCALVEGSRAALNADGHLGYSQPIGGVVAYRDHISPSGVGYDIGCGNLAVRTDAFAADLKPVLPQIMNEIVERISFGMGRSNPAPVDHPVLDAIREADFTPQRGLRELAAKQLGTVGAGNHYVDLFRDEYGAVWVGVHFGSRGFGHKTASGFLSIAQGLPFSERGKDGEMDSPPVLFQAASPLGEAYIAAMQLAGAYAHAGREVVVSEVLSILGAEAVSEVHNHHNYAWRETHGGEDFWVVRKGCTPAFPGQEGFVGASMGETSVILRGRDSELNRDLLYSAPHGAGRAMSRTAAAGRPTKVWYNNLRDDGTAYPSQEAALAAPGATKAKKGRGRTRTGGAIDWPATQSDLRTQGIELRGGAADEAPLAYKRLSEVLQYHEEAVEITAYLKPIGVAMAGADTIDLYKD